MCEFWEPNSRWLKPKQDVFAHEIEKSSGFRCGLGTPKMSLGTPLPFTFFIVT